MKPKVQHPTTGTAAAVPSGGGWNRNSPVPYLFAGVALMFGVVVAALILLACSYTESSEPSNSNHEKSHKTEHVLQPEMEPRIVVIMAGDTNPTYLAKPVAAAALRRSEEEV